MHDSPEIAWAVIEEQVMRVGDKLDKPLLEAIMFATRRFLTECHHSHLQGRLHLSKTRIHPFSQWSFPCTSLYERSRALWATVKSFAWFKPIGEDHPDPDVDSVFFVRIFEPRNEHLARIYLSRRGNMTEISRHRRVMGHFGRVVTS